MESGEITDGQITASSEWSSTHAPSLARLNRVKEGNKAGSWAAKTNDVNQWLQIELGSDYTKVTRIVTQGRSDYDQWVKTYKLQYSEDGVNYQFYREQGQTEDKVLKQNIFSNIGSKQFKPDLKYGELPLISPPPPSLTSLPSYRLSYL